MTDRIRKTFTSTLVNSLRSVGLFLPGLLDSSYAIIINPLILLMRLILIAPIGKKEQELEVVISSPLTKFVQQKLRA